MKAITVLSVLLFGTFAANAGGFSSAGGNEKFLMKCGSDKYLFSMVEWNRHAYVNLVSNPHRSPRLVGKIMVSPTPSTGSTVSFFSEDGSVDVTLHYTYGQVDKVILNKFNAIENESIDCDQAPRSFE